MLLENLRRRRAPVVRTPERPAHIYSACKLALKNVALQLATDAGVPLVWARVFYLHGPFEDPRRLMPFVERHVRKVSVIRILLDENYFFRTDRFDNSSSNSRFSRTCSATNTNYHKKILTAETLRR